MKVPLPRLWFGIAASPAAWTVMLLAGYAGAARGCLPGWPGARRLGHPSATVLELSAAMLALAVAGLVVALGNLRRTDDHGHHKGLAEMVRTSAPPRSRDRFMALGGATLSALFLLGVVLFALPSIITNVCGEAR